MSHDALADRLWYVRRRGQVLGPFSITELTKLRDRGNLAAFDEVSEDRASWVRYERLAEMLEPKPPPEEPIAVAPPGGYPMAPPPASRDLRSTSLGLSMLWIGHLLEMLAGLCLVVFIAIVAVQGKPTAAGVVFLLWIGLSIGYQIVECIGYGLASGGPSESGPKGLPVTCLILQIVDFLLVVVLLVLLMIFGSAAQVLQAQDQVAQVAVPLLFGARMVLWVPMTIVLVEWLKALAGRVEKADPQGRGYSRNVLSQSTYLYILYAMQNLALALAYLVHLLSDVGFDALQRVTDKIALTFILFSVVYLMLATVVGIWRIALLFMSWKSVREPGSPGGVRYAAGAASFTRDVELPEPQGPMARTAGASKRGSGAARAGVPPSSGELVASDSPQSSSWDVTKYAILIGGFVLVTITTVLVVYFVSRREPDKTVVASASKRETEPSKREPDRPVAKAEPRVQPEPAPREPQKPLAPEEAKRDAEADRREAAPPAVNSVPRSDPKPPMPKVNSPDVPKAEPAGPPADRLAINSDSDEKISEAVGLVAALGRVTRRDRTTVHLTGTGTCFAVTPDGYLVTNKHVVDFTEGLREIPELKGKVASVTTSKVWVFINGSEYPAQIVHKSKGYDLAVLKIDRSDAAYFRLNGLEKNLQGKFVAAVGFPAVARVPLNDQEEARMNARAQNPKNVADMFRLKKSDFGYSLTRGAIARHRDEEAVPPRKWVEHKAEIHKGNSGGPLLLENGIVIGVNTLGVEGAFYSSFTLPQLRDEIDRVVQGVRWE